MLTITIEGYRSVVTYLADIGDTADNRGECLGVCPRGTSLGDRRVQNGWANQQQHVVTTVCWLVN